ncbi:MAG: TetR/AcrR family transcriptional regulator [Ruminococcaceae bacterium]|nr:TetR/AcrR family transcriptional regulator [Oscillospiraceae bacterium]
MPQTASNHPRNLSNNEANKITRESICTALLELLKTKDFKDISVSELVRRAGVSRQSFYRNYKTKEDIVLEIEKTIGTRLIEKMNDPSYINNPKKWFIEFFSVVRENTVAVTLLQKSDLFITIFERVPSYIESHLGTTNHEIHYSIVASIAAAHAIAREWFRNGMKENEAEMAELCMNFSRATYNKVRNNQENTSVN